MQEGADDAESEQGEDEPGEHGEDVDPALKCRVHGESEQAANREQRDQQDRAANQWTGCFGWS